jgi:hypothetical protein
VVDDGCPFNISRIARVWLARFSLWVCHCNSCDIGAAWLFSASGVDGTTQLTSIDAGFQCMIANLPLMLQDWELSSGAKKRGKHPATCTTLAHLRRGGIK